MKTSLYPEDVVVAYARARVEAGRSSGAAERIEEFLAASTGATSTSKVELALDARRPHPRAARRLARERRRVRDACGRRHPAADRPLGRDQRLRHPHRSTSASRRSSPTQRRPGPYRGAGRPEAIFMIERLMDEAARQTGIDPDRAAPPQHDPARADAVQATRWTRPTTAAQFALVMDRALALADWKGFAGARGGVEAPRQAARARHRDVPRMDRRRRLRARASTSRSTGDGRRSRSSPPRSRWGRASRRPSRSSRSTSSAWPIGQDPHRARRHRSRRRASAAPARGRCSSVGSAVRVASERTVAKAHELAAAGARSGGRRHRVPRRRVQHRRHRPAASASSTSRSGSPTGASCSHSSSAVDAPSWPNGCHICEVEVDPDTGAVAARRLLVGQRRRPRRQSDGRHRSARRRRGAGHRAGAVRARSSTTPRSGQALTATLHGLRAAAREHDPRASR